MSKRKAETSNPRISKARPQRRGPESKARKAVIATARKMSNSGLSPGRSGNVSCRLDAGILITPTGMTYEDLTPDDIVYLAADGTVPRGQRAPSSEWRFHVAAYQARPDRHAVVHTHSLHATVLACAHRSIPAFHYMVAVAGGADIPLVPYATFGTQKLADNVAEELRGRDACLMANHGAIAIGETLESALALAFEIEVLAEQYYKVIALGGPHLLLSSEMAEVLEKFKVYGQQVVEASPSSARRKP